MSECTYEIINFPKYHRKNLIDFCPESLFRLGMLCPHLSRVALRIIKTNHMYLAYKTFQGRNLSNFFGGNLENQWFHKYILTLSDLYVLYSEQDRNNQIQTRTFLQNKLHLNYSSHIHITVMEISLRKIENALLHKTFRCSPPLLQKFDL